MSGVYLRHGPSVISTLPPRASLPEHRLTWRQEAADCAAFVFVAVLLGIAFLWLVPALIQGGP